MYIWAKKEIWFLLLDLRDLLRYVLRPCQVPKGSEGKRVRFQTFQVRNKLPSNSSYGKNEQTSSWYSWRKVLLSSS